MDISNARVLVLDFETYFDSEYSLSKMPTLDYVMDPRFEAQCLAIHELQSGASWSIPKEAIAETLSVIDWSKRCFVSHHVMFDGLIAWKHFGVRPALFLDTLGIGRAVLANELRSYSLNALAEHLGLGSKIAGVLNKYRGRRWATMSEPERREHMGYCQHDANLCAGVFRRLAPKLPGREAMIIDHTARMYFDPKLRLNADVLQGIIDKDDAEREEVLKRAHLTGAGDILRSSEKFATWLRTWGLEDSQIPRKKNAKGKDIYAFAKTDLDFLALKEHPNPMIRHAVTARLKEKSSIEATRAARLLHWAKSYQGMLHVPLAYYSAHTGRYGGWDKVNLQNLPHESPLRRAIEAPPGKAILAVDASQIEARLNAWWSGEQSLVTEFEQGIDIYCTFASGIYKRTITKDDKEERFVGKVGRLSLQYGVGHVKFGHTLAVKGVKAEDGQFSRGVVSYYRATHKAIVNRWYDCGRLLDVVASEGAMAQREIGPVLFTNENRIELPNKMAIRYPHLSKHGDNDWFYGPENKRRKIYGSAVVENVIQALARIIVFDTMIEARRMGLFAVMNVHDELLFVVDQDAVNEAAETVVRLMSRVPEWARPNRGIKLPLAAEAGWGANYAEAK